MAIGFARLEFVKRSDGKNAVAKAAYNSRSTLSIEEYAHGKAQKYDWSRLEKPLHHEILLPGQVDGRFLSPQVLWNAVEKFEGRKNSQVALDMVLALPDDKVVSVQDRIELARQFAKEQFVSKGFGVQLDLHTPEQNKGTGEEEHNWHAHLLVTPRRFREDGLSFETHKPRHLMPEVKKGRVVSAPSWGKHWMQFQNEYFESKGWTLRVDPNGVISQIHLGPFRMRGRAFSLIEEQGIRQELNTLASEDPKKILESLTETRNIFSVEEVDRFLHKHAPLATSDLRQRFWEQSEIVQLLDPSTHEPMNRYTTRQIVEEEDKTLRIADRIHSRSAIKLSDKNTTLTPLNTEQTKAFKAIISGQRLCCIEGWAGTGKSYLLAELRRAYEKEGYTVRGFGPDNATAKVLKECGFQKAENLYRFTFSHYHKAKEIGDSEVWILDEAGKIGTRPLLEFLKIAEKRDAQVILSGDPAQMPSVDRGTMYQTFIQRYGSQALREIKRQATEEERTIAKNLAMGRISEAFDAISKTGGFRWAETKQKAMEQLVKQWAMDKELFPQSTSIIVAHTNAEIRTLNELVRVYLREQNKWKTEEFLCQTAYGKIYVSQGDPIEFRKNDTQLGVTNGLSGFIVEASATKFAVRVKNGEKSRDIVFNPQEYSFFQLGYATTFYRSQGRTIDRAYVLHSPWMNKEMFYVGLTRHVRKAFCFISKSEARCLAELKWQACRKSRTEVTTDFITQDRLQAQAEDFERKQTIDQLKQSKSFMVRLKGQTLGLVESLQTSTHAVVQKFRDRSPDHAFFDPELSSSSHKSTVVQVPITTNTEAREFSLPTTTVRPTHRDQNPTSHKSEERAKAWESLSSGAKKTLQDYYSASDHASTLYSMVKAEVEASNKNERLVAHFQEWQEACGQRNKAAYDAMQALSPKELKTLFRTEQIETLSYRSIRHETSLQRKNEYASIENQLRDHMEELLFKLYPEGPTRRSAREYRYGSKGALSVSCLGAAAGTYYDFEKGEGGGLLKLIEHTRSLQNEQAFQWARNFVSGAIHSPVKPWLANSLELKNTDSWESQKPALNSPAPDLRTISKKLDEQYNEVARHSYKDETGQILFYTLRLMDKNTAKKLILPLSYGCYKGNETSPRWSLKSYQTKNRPLYHLDLLLAQPQATVLVVEGEKTADAANQIFAGEKIIAVSWMGGCSAVNKTDWTPLMLRELIIWPDNDLAGFQASDAIVCTMRRLGVHSLKVVNQELLQREFTAKWDLADPLPPHRSIQDLRDLLFNATDQAVGAAELCKFVGYDPASLSHLFLAREILWRVEERRRPALRAEFGSKSWEIQQQILTEAAKFLPEKKELFDSQRTQAWTFASAIYQAQTGQPASDSVLKELKRSLSYQTLHKLLDQNDQTCNKDISVLVVSKYLAECLERGIASDLPKKAEQLKQEMVALSKQIQAHQVSNSQERRMENLRGFDRSLL